MRRMLAGSLTVIIMVLMIGVGLRRPVPPYVADAESAVRPEGALSRFPDSRLQDASERIEGLLGSARKGDVTAYIGAFAGPLRARLEHEAQERGQAAFAAQLRRAGQARKSHAVFAAEPDLASPDAARITVETAYADRLERQTFRLERASGGWLVTEVETARDVVPKNVVGSLATYEEPEGVPVPIP
jgi:hypothetical protein